MPRTYHHTPKWTPGFRPCYSAGTRKLPSPQIKETLHSTHSWQQGSPCSSIKEWECQILHWGEESYNLLLCRWQEKPCSPKIHRSPTLHTAHKWMRVTPLLRAGIPAPQWVAICYSAGARRFTPRKHRDSELPTVTAGDPLCPHQQLGPPAPSLRGEKK
jgi:hypothetical protein